MRGGHGTILVLEYSCSVIIASNPGFLFRIFLAALEKNGNVKPGLESSDIT